MTLTEIKQLFEIIKKDINAFPKPTELREKVLFCYNHWCLDRLKELLKDLTSEKVCLHPELADKLNDFLSQNWSLVNGSLLSPTAIPNADITKLLCGIAQFVAETKNKDLPAESALVPIKVLMPTITIDSIRDDYPTFDINSDLNTILNTHILGREGLFLLPVKLLTELKASVDKDTQKLRNPYPDQSKDDASIYYVNAEEKERLIKHSPLSEALCETLKRYNVLTEDKSTLLGQLNDLCFHLSANSSTGVGTELDAGSMVYPAIIQFMEYYHTLKQTNIARIPEVLGNEIKLLLQLTTDSNINFHAANNIATCIATRRLKLLSAMEKQEELLNSIAPSAKTMTTLITNAKLNFAKARSDLENTLASRYSGTDNLGLSPELLETLYISFRINNYEDLIVLQALSAEEMDRFLQKKGLRKQIISAIAELDNIVIFLTELNVSKVRAFVKNMKKELLEGPIFSMRELRGLLMCLDNEKCRVICEIMLDDNQTIIPTAGSLCLLLEKLSPEKQTIVLEAMQKLFQDMINLFEDILLFNFLSSEQLNIIFEAVEEKLLNIVDGSTAFSQLLESFHSKQQLIFNIMKNKWLGFIESEDDCDEILAVLSEEQQEIKNLVIFIRNLHNSFGYCANRSVKNLATALLEDNRLKIKTTFNALMPMLKVKTLPKHLLIFRLQSWGDTFIDNIASLSPCWLKKIDEAVNLGLFELKDLSQNKIKKAIKEYSININYGKQSTKQKRELDNDDENSHEIKRLCRS
jgi:hypothetical protein